MTEYEEGLGRDGAGLLIVLELISKEYKSGKIEFAYNGPLFTALSLFPCLPFLPILFYPSHFFFLSLSLPTFSFLPHLPPSPSLHLPSLPAPPRDQRRRAAAHPNWRLISNCLGGASVMLVTRVTVRMCNGALAGGGGGGDAGGAKGRRKGGEAFRADLHEMTCFVWP